MLMYLFEPGFLADVLAGRAPDYAAVSHAGHGTNSYAVNYHLVHGNLAVLMQVGWGGIYTDNAAAARRLGNLWRRCEALHGLADGRRIVCVYSDIRGVSACGPAGGDVNGFFAAHHTVGEAAFDTAERLLA
ncbi:hypothetical protein AB0K00_41515 [Dactylosporangium sp. NPDC049525]|uniref:hypothetical protein n=1 Tax=Dactylosporangium sp. NPDC049525 TaxID=3154730 RepID=UPI003424068B